MNRLAKLVIDGLYKEALFHYSQLHKASILPNKFTFPSLLKACAKLQAVSHGQMLHTHLIKAGFYQDIYTATALTDMYMKFHLLDSALKLFDDIPEPNITLFNVIISGFLQNGCAQEAFNGFSLAALRGCRPDSFTISSLLSACEGVRHGVQIHCWAIKIGVEADVYAASSLMTMYSDYGHIGSAAKVFDLTLDKNVVCYNAFISGLLQNGVPRVVLDVFKDMKGSLHDGSKLVTLVSVVSACADLKSLRFGLQVHGYICRIALDFDTMIGTALIDMYSKCGHWQWAYDVFEELNGNRNLIMWNSIIAGMMSNGQTENAVDLFVQLESEGLEPDSVTWNSVISGFSQLGKHVETFTFFRKMQLAGEAVSLKSIASLLPACASLSALRCGKAIHSYVIRTQKNQDEFITTGLIDMYMKCGLSSWAERMFNQPEMKPHDPAIWNAMISGYGMNCETQKAFALFDQMVTEKVQPTSTTFNCILSACSHSGQVEKGCQIFRMMCVNGLNPTVKHFSCMVDLLGRSGKLDEAQKLLQEIPETTASQIASLLGACKNYSNSNLGEETAKMLLELQPVNPIPFVILSNIYAVQGRWTDMQRVREMISEKNLRKLPGFSLIAMT